MSSLTLITPSNNYASTTSGFRTPRYNSSVLIARSGTRILYLTLLLAVICPAGSAPGQSAPDRTEDGRYPAHWWEAVPEADRAWWEIPPQAAGPGEVVLSKRNELGLLSNFAATPFEFRGERYASLEGLWQSMKYPEGPEDPRALQPGVTWPHTRREVTRMVAFEANEAGSRADEIMRAMGIDWITFEGERIRFMDEDRQRHLEIIEAATWAKVRQNPEVEGALLATGDLVLRPDHITEIDPPPAWRYYDIYMRIRRELQEPSDR